MDFAPFDARGYRTVGVRDGYDGWADSYERSVPDEADIALLEAIESVRWADVERAADLGCGTGRTGRWLRGHGVGRVDGVDISSEMLARARAGGGFELLRQAEVADSGLPGGAYDLVTTCLVDEHLRELGPLYAESARLAGPSGAHVLVGYHPHFAMATGMPTHYDDASGEPVAIEMYVHLFSEHVAAAGAAGWRLEELRERVVDDAFLAVKPGWARFRGHPFSFAMVWRRGGNV